MLDEKARGDLTALLRPLRGEAEPCLRREESVACLLFILAAVEFVSLYYAGSRRPAHDGGSAAFSRFLTRYFPRFGQEARDAGGRVRRVRVPLLKTGGKATKRMRISSALVHLYRRGVIHDLVAPAECLDRCVILGSGRWGFQINVRCFQHDFREALRRYEVEVCDDPSLAHRFLTRFGHLHGWDPP